MSVPERVGIISGIRIVRNLEVVMKGDQVDEKLEKELQQRGKFLREDIIMESLIGAITTLEILVCLLLAEKREIMVIVIGLTGVLLFALDRVTKADATQLQDLLKSIELPDTTETS